MSGLAVPMLLRRGPGGQRRIRGGGALLIPNLTFAALGCLVGSIIGGRTGLALASIGTLAAAWSALSIGRRMLPQSLIFPVLICVYGIQIVVQLLLTIVDSATLTNHLYNLELSDYTTALTMGHVSVLGGSLLGAAALSAIGFRKRRISLDLTQAPPPRAKIFLVIALSMCLLQSAVPYLLPSRARWLFLIFAANLDVACFFGGWFVADLRGKATWCLLALLANCAIGGLMGTRYALVLLGLYVAGRLVSPRERHRRRVLITALAASMPLLLVFWIVGDVRASRGRDNIELLNFSNISGFLGAANSSLARNEAKGGSFTGDAIGRLYAWPNAAITILTPEVVPYRGIGGWISEVPSYVRIWGWSDDARERAFAEGTGNVHAAEYGFSDTVETSVEFGVLADGWSSAGPLGAVMVAAMVAFFICALEFLVFHRMGLSYAARLILLCILAKSCLICSVYPGPMIVRNAVLNVLLWVFVFKAADFLPRGRPARVFVRPRFAPYYTNHGRPL